MFRFPFSNLHELNLDWILSQVKKFSELIPDMETATEDVSEAIDTANEAKTIAEEALEASDPTLVQQAITTANQAKTIAEEALETADPELVQQAITTANQAKTIAEQALETADPELVQQAIDTAEEAQATAEEALELIEQAVSVTLSDTTPIMDSASGSAGVAGTASRGDHSHPSDTTKVSKAGDTMTGALTIKSANIDGTAGVNGNGVTFSDASNSHLIEFYPRFDTISRLVSTWSVLRTVNNQQITHSFTLGIDSQGVPFVGINRPAWLTALNILPTVVNIQLLTANWTTTLPNVYTQTISLAGVTANTKIDLQFTPTVVAQMINDGTTTLFIENNNTVLTVFAFGVAPSVNITVQATKYETN